MYIYHNISLNSSQNEKRSKALEKNKTSIFCLTIFFLRKYRGLLCDNVEVYSTPRQATEE